MNINHFNAMKTTTVIFVIVLLPCTLCDDYYKLLGIERDADSRDIRRAFKKLALKFHPDKNQGDPEAHDKFVKINKAYEVLKDPDVRKRYDTYGEEGLDGDQSGWGRQYHSWNYYYEKFGIYDDDPEVVTLSRNDFQSSVVESEDVWFVNYYSPQCSHCHHLAPAWRQLARSFEGVIRIGAVNCEEDWQLCRQEGIHAFPSLIFYPEREKYAGSRDFDDLNDFVLRRLPDLDIDISETGLLHAEASSLLRSVVVASCTSTDMCLANEELKKLAVALNGLAYVSLLHCSKEAALCKKLGISDGVYFFEAATSELKKPRELEGSDASELRKAVLKELPSFEPITSELFNGLIQQLDGSDESEPWLLHFFKSKQLDTAAQLELKHIRGYIQSVRLGSVDCSQEIDVCVQFSVTKSPVFILLRSSGEYEVYHGRVNARDLASFAKESAGSRLQALTIATFERKVLKGRTTWLVDFFAPWCPPCMRTLPELRKVSRSFEDTMFGVVDCTSDASLCQSNGVSSYPSLVLFHNGSTTSLSGYRTAAEIKEFIEISLDPKVIKLSPETFKELVESKSENDVWAIDFFAPWCGHCKKLAPEWNKFAKVVANEVNINVGQLDCDAHRQFCAEHGVRSYPHLRIYPRGQFSSRHYSTFNGWSRDAASFRDWAMHFLPSSVEELDHHGFYKDVLGDTTPWLVDFYAPWCGHCVSFRPVFESVAKKFEGRVKFGAVNCEEHWHACDAAQVHRYPTVMFFVGRTTKIQSAVGNVIHNHREADLVNTLELFLKQKLRSKRIDDEL
nr:dnaJ homolog subfamily C member 10-like [Rhipicephalus microplus]